MIILGNKANGMKLKLLSAFLCKQPVSAVAACQLKFFVNCFITFFEST